jgi:hypothetical protein
MLILVRKYRRLSQLGASCVRARLVVGFTIAYAIGAYYQ